MMTIKEKKEYLNDMKQLVARYWESRSGLIGLQWVKETEYTIALVEKDLNEEVH